MDAPLSSPSLGHAPKHQQQHQHSYFTRSSSSSTSTSSSSNYSSGPAAASAYPSSYTTTTHAQQQSTQSLQQRADATSPFLKDFNLVAEAAKRAQMACLMRDLEGVGISGS